jgi:hypothetical protein
MRKIASLLMVFSFINCAASAQIDLNKIFNINDLIGKALNVKKGFAPKFSLGNTPINSISKVGEIFQVKNIAQATKLFNTFKTGRTVYRVASAAGSAIALYGTIRALDKAAVTKDYQAAITAGLVTIGTGLITKFLTRAAAYKAVDVFNGAVTKKIKDIFSIQPASSTIGMGLYVKL